MFLATETPFHPDDAWAPLRLLLKTLAELSMAALVLSMQPAQAQGHAHRSVFPLEHANSADSLFQVPPPTRMVPLQAAFSQGYPTIGVNADGSDLWPCYGHSPVANADCPTIGNPPLPFPRGAFMGGVPAFSWALKNNDILGFGLGNGVGCDAYVDGTTGLSIAQYKPCGQITTFFEDDTNDANDDLLQRIVVTQGFRIIYDSGTVDFGPAGPTVKYPVDVELSYDANFGFWPGAKRGPNNGNCTIDIGYPLTKPEFPGFPYQVAAGNTCERALPGKARFHTITTLATPTYKQVTGRKCTAHEVASPCYVVSWEQKYEISQDWDIFFW